MTREEIQKLILDTVQNQDQFDLWPIVVGCLGPCPRIDWQPIFPEKVRSVRLHGYIFPQGSEENNLS